MSNKAKPPPSTTPVVIDESSIGWKLFNAFINAPETTITEDELRSYAFNELNLSEENMTTELKENLPVILIAFMNMWSGWHFKSKYEAGEFGKEHYFGRFQKFMLHKMTSTLKSNALKAVDSQTISGTGSRKNDPEFSPYAIEIKCPAYMLNTIVFSNSGDDVIMKQHLGSKWQDLHIIHLLHWPFVEIMFRTQDICFVRRQATEFVRYLNFLPHESNRYSENILEHVETLPNYGHTRECYSYSFLDTYIKSYLEALKALPQVSGHKYDEISKILAAFLDDVKYININNSSMATNTVVLFRLSKVPFIRNKKLVKNPEKEPEEARVGYCEIITPKVELVLMYFRATQKDHPDQIQFDFVEKLKKAPPDANVLPQITYKCTFCKEEFTEGDTLKYLLCHLKTFHKMEQHVRCTLCKRQFDVVNLTACRWRHKCLPPSPSTTSAKK